MPVDVPGPHLKSAGVGPEVTGVFFSGSGEKVGRPRRRHKLGDRVSRPQAQSLNISPPVDSRPKKRSRALVDDETPGFGFVGFTLDSFLVYVIFSTPFFCLVNWLVFFF
ncbi:hypothetical protein Hanom_Chr10g00911641 [Helianthus anomalus]